MTPLACLFILLATSAMPAAAAGEAKPSSGQKPIEVLNAALARWAEVVQPPAGQAARTFVTRVKVVKAEGLPAMLLPPQSLAAIDGLALYPAQPSLGDQVDGRTDAMTSTRTDSATYMLQRPGNYVLPAIDIAWWNVGSGKVERIHLDEVPLAVAVNPMDPTASSAGQQS